jgi:hypothetical protein
MKEKSTLEFIGGIVGNVIAIVIVNSVPFWLHLTNGIIRESWVNILWAANLSMMVQVSGNFVLALYRPARLYSFIQAIMAAVGLLSVIVFYIVFPLDFSHFVGSWMNIFMKAALILGMFGTVIAIIVHLVRTVLGTAYTEAQAKS